MLLITGLIGAAVGDYAWAIMVAGGLYMGSTLSVVVPVAVVEDKGQDVVRAWSCRSATSRQKLAAGSRLLLQCAPL